MLRLAIGTSSPTVREFIAFGGFQVEMKALVKPNGNTVEPDEMTSMLHSQSQYDVASGSLLGDEGREEPRYSTMGRRPIIIASHPHRDGRSTDKYSYTDTP